VRARPVGSHIRIGPRAVAPPISIFRNAKPSRAPRTPSASNPAFLLACNESAACLQSPPLRGEMSQVTEGGVRASASNRHRNKPKNTPLVGDADKCSPKGERFAHHACPVLNIPPTPCAWNRMQYAQRERSTAAC